MVKRICVTQEDLQTNDPFAEALKRAFESDIAVTSIYTWRVGEIDYFGKTPEIMLQASLLISAGIEIAPFEFDLEYIDWRI